ncbi:MAG TPA: carboxypeptidase regulatory-like domain-containing protein [Gemmatimonadales bacterium]|nr:carboxypeptidase regulatory-like domain-containing protein [Gemmatimonadales bacterium]
MTCGIRSLARRLAVLVGAVLALLGTPAVLVAQSQATTGIIRGVVADPSGRSVNGATVTVRDVQTNFTRTLTTDEKGVFVAPLLPLGTYDVVAKAVGFSQATAKGVPVRVGETVDLKLALAAVELAPVVVEARETPVEASRVATSDRLSAAAVTNLPNNGRNFLNLTLLTPDVGIVQGPDGDELSVAGQRGIHNNISVDGADFNNPFFGEQRGGQRPPFTFNLDAVQEIVVTASGATAEFGRSSSGFVNVITKSGTNELKGSLHYFGKYDWLSADLAHNTETLTPDFRQHQFGFTLGGPLKRDKAFFFVAYDQQVYDDVKQKIRPTGAAFDSLISFTDTAFGGALRNDFGSIARTNDARAALAKIDWRLSDRTNLSLKYNYTWSQQQNGTFDVDTWGRSANGLEKDWSNAVNGSLVSYLSSRLSNELRFQWSREDRPRPYDGPINPVTGRPFPDTGMDFGSAFRFGMPFFLPIQDHDTRLQALDNLSFAKGDHFFKAGAEWNRTETDQTFIGFANGRFIFGSVTSFINYVENGTGGPLLYLQQAGVGGLSVEQAGTQAIVQNELALFLQDTWKPSAKLTVDYGLRWEAQIEPDPITPPSQVFFAPFIGKTKTTAAGPQVFPSDGTIPSDWKMFQPRFGFAYDPDASGKQVIRGSAGVHYARIPGLNLASVRSTNGSIGQTLTGPVPPYGQLISSAGPPNHPDVYVYDKDFENPRTISATIGYERQLTSDLSASISYTHASTDHLTRFFNSNDGAFASPWSTGLPDTAGGSTNGIGTLWTEKSNAKSRYNGVTVGIKRLLDPNFQFELNYTLGFDKSDDDNERDPFTLRYALANNLAPEYNWSDRDQRHRFNGWALVRLPGDIHLDNRVSYYSAQPTSASCGPSPGNPFAPPAGQRATVPADRICADGSVLVRNTLRKDNAFFSWDLSVSRPFSFGRQGQAQVIVEVFNLFNTDNFRDPSYGNLLFNFDGTIRSGLGDPRQLQAGVRWVF